MKSHLSTEPYTLQVLYFMFYLFHIFAVPLLLSQSQVNTEKSVKNESVHKIAIPKEIPKCQ